MINIGTKLINNLCKNVKFVAFFLIFIMDVQMSCLDFTISILYFLLLLLYRQIVR